MFRFFPQLFALACTALLLSSSAEADSAQSVLIPPNKRILSYYNKPFDSLNRKERWLIGVHGLRGTPLHRREWAVRQIERTVNRQIVPIRTYYLRASENPSFRVKEITVNFVMKRAGANGYDDRVLDISFASEHVPAVAGRPPLVDRGYTFRLSAANNIASAFFYRSDLTKVSLLPLDSLKLIPEKEYTVVLKFETDSVSFMLNNKNIGSYSSRELNTGMIALTGGWIPITINELKISALGADGTEAEYSGLVPQFHRGGT